MEGIFPGSVLDHIGQIHKPYKIGYFYAVSLYAQKLTEQIKVLQIMQADAPWWNTVDISVTFPTANFA